MWQLVAALHNDKSTDGVTWQLFASRINCRVVIMASATATAFTASKTEAKAHPQRHALSRKFFQCTATLA